MHTPSLIIGIVGLSLLFQSCGSGGETALVTPPPSVAPAPPPSPPEPPPVVALAGFVEASADTNWHGTYTVLFPDGTRRTGASTMTPGMQGIAFPLVVDGCTLSQSCVTVNDTTISTVLLDQDGTAELTNLGTVSWRTQILWVLPGDPSPPAAVLADVTGTLHGIPVAPPASAFAFNGTLTAFFTAFAGGQKIRAIRLDFAESPPPPQSHLYRQTDGVFSVWIDNGVPVMLGTPR